MEHCYSSLPLCERQLVDSCVWNHTVYDAYLVKSVYYLCLSMAASSMPSNNETDRNWNLIWKQQIPPKVRAFMWRTTHCCLPTCCQLLQKGVLCEDGCVPCDIMAETHTHLFFVCPKALDCWAFVHLDNIARDTISTVNDFTTLLFEFFDRLNAQHKSLACMILWNL